MFPNSSSLLQKMLTPSTRAVSRSSAARDAGVHTTPSARADTTSTSSSSAGESESEEESAASVAEDSTSLPLRPSR